MKKLVIGALLAGSALAPTQALAQAAPSLEEQVAALIAEVGRLNQRVAELEADQAQAQAQQASVAVEQAAMAAQFAALQEATPAAPSVTSGSPLEISWAGAPEIEGEGGWSFKPRGRLNIDSGIVSAPDGINDGFDSEMRRVRLGVEGTIPGGFGYKFEVDVAGNSVEVTDAILTYEDGPLEISVGQHNTFQSLEELTSSRWSSFIERAAFTDAFGFERRLGVSVQVEATEDLLLQAGVFTDNIGDLPNEGAWSADGRVVYMPRIGDARLHLGASIHHAEMPSGSTARYRQRPLVHFTGDRFVNTGNFSADSETGIGAEAAFLSGRFHVVGEGFWQSVDRPGAQVQDPTFFGGYVEAGVFLTNDSRGYRGGTFNRTRPSSPVDEGGMGAWQLNVRYDRLDLNDAGIVGGTQDGYFASLVWVPTDYTRFMLNYGRLDYNDAAILSGSGSTDYSVDVLGMRAQIDF